MMIRASIQLAAMTVARRVVVVVVVGTLVACGDGSSTRDHQSDTPQPGDPRFGAAGNVLVSDDGISSDGTVDKLWIGFDDEGRWQTLLRLTEGLGATGARFISGRVVADASQPLGFYFDPASTQASEVVAESLQTSIDAIKANPDEFAKNEPFGRWAIAGKVERTTTE